jgi:TATA-binding protein-associated factor
MIVISYEALRSDISFFSKFDFNFVVLDEAHIIKNPKAKITQAVKSLRAQIRIALTGTPL